MDSATAQALQNAISDEEIIELEMNLIRIPSYTTEETELGKFIVRYLQSEGIAAELQEVPLPKLAEGKSERKVSHNVIGVLPGNGTGPSLMFNGHMDHGPWDVRGRVVDAFSEWQRSPFEPTIEEGRIYGKAAQDEKGGICGMLAAAVAIKRAGIKPKGDIYLCPVMGHKTHSVGTKYMMEVGPHADYGINTENSGNWIVPAHIGIVSARVHIHGADARMRYRLPETMDKTTGFMNAFRFVKALGKEGVRHPNDGWTSFNPHPVLSEWPDHRIDFIDKVSFDHIVVGLILKTVPGMDEETYRLDLKRVLNTLERKHSDFIGGEVETEVWGPPLDTPFNSPVVQALSSAYLSVTGEKPRVGIEGRFSAYGCGSVMAAKGIETCIFGPGGQAVPGGEEAAETRQARRGDLPPDEYISIRELVASARTMALAAVNLSC
jgi:acetylornithine deacetylase/succinyl-diaminopimelate desuccinylase-like protein